MKGHRAPGPYPPAFRAMVVRCLHDGMAIRAAARTFNVSANTLRVWRYDGVSQQGGRHGVPA